MNVTIGGIARTVEITSFDKLGDVKVCMLTTTADGSVGFQQLNQEVIDTIYASFPVDTAKGDIASFEDGADNVPVRELKLNLEPYQNLNGYDHPWVGGAEKNKLPTPVEGTYSASGITIKVDSKGVITVSGTSTASDVVLAPLSESYVIPTAISQGGSGCMYLFNSFTTGTGNAFTMYNNSTLVETWQFTTTNRKSDTWVGQAGNTINKVGVKFTSGQTYSGTFAPMFSEDGTTDATSFTPYSNICPIYPANGKNLLENVVADDVKTIGGITYTRLSDGSVIANGTATSASFYCPDVSTASATPVTDHNMFLDAYIGQKLIVTGTPSGIGSANIRIMIGRQAGSSLANDIGSGATFTVSETGLWVGIRIESGTTVNNAHFYPMIRHAEITDSAYVPYNAIGITRTGKNLWSLSSSGSATNNFVFPAQDMNTVPPGSYTLSFYGTIGTAVQFTFRKADNTSIASAIINSSMLVSGRYVASITLNESAYRVSVYSNGTASINNIQLEVGSSATQYEPYTAERYYPISNNPVYGGTLEVETGVLTVTKGYVDMGTLAWANATSGGTSVSAWTQTTSLVGIVKNGVNTQVEDLTCSQYKADTANRVYLGNVGIGLNVGGNISIYDTNFTGYTGAQIKTALSGVQLVYPLATPVQYQLTPVQVKTLLGYNNIWTDSGTVEVQYLANIGLYIQKIIGSSEEDMVANQNIQANKYFFVGEELFLSTTAIAQGASIVVGTNCIRTNLADALNALNS